MPGLAGSFDLLTGLGGGESSGNAQAMPPGGRLQSLPSCSDNPLVRAATRLLNLVPRVRALSAVADPASLRHSLIAEVRFFEEQALAANVSRDEIIGARYCLCTALDEAAAQTPWGSKGVWSKQSLLVTFHNETHGGEKYYQLLGRLAQYPERHRHLIELLYYCNALGFEGKFRVTENGHAQLEILKRRIAALLNTVRNGYEQRLSPNWKGVEVRREAWRMVPPWVVALLCALLAFAIYVWLSFLLEPDSDKVFRRLVSLEPPSPLVERPVVPRLRRFLEPEIRAGLLEVRDLSDRSIITLMGDGLFDSGSAEVRPNYLGVLGRIAHGLDEIDGSVVVTGYTDNVPMRSARFPSNWHLSEARARTVAALLSGRMQRHVQARADGRGEAEPVAANDTPEGRARNRRVEITLMLSGDEIHRQLNPDAAVQASEVRQ